MADLLIIYHTRTSGSEQMARAAYMAAEPECDTRILRCEDTHPKHLLAADGYIFVCPENLASMSGEMKAFFDRCYYPVLGKIEGRPYATMICAGSDGEGAARQIARITKGWRLKPIGEPLIVCTHAQTEREILASKTLSNHQLLPCAELGQAFGLGLVVGIY